MSPVLSFLSNHDGLNHVTTGREEESNVSVIEGEGNWLS